ncbi:MAG: RsmB/NOP family class I SAM-dependent RNA methyltransferase [Candidatus Aenigmatarchaeota archaeon]
MKIAFLPGFEKKFKEILGEEFCKLEECLHIRPKKTIRINTLKVGVKKIKERLTKKGWKLEEVPWYRNAFFVDSDEKISKAEEHFLGYFYIQDAASLVPPLVLDPKENEIILDLCASPGSKTTFIAELMKNSGLIIANDISPKRIEALSYNLQKIGVCNTIVTMIDGRKIEKINMKFDKVLVDAPCSGSGTFISSFSVLNFWSEHIVKRLSNLQKQLIKSASKVVKNGGEIVYSTCSIDPEENEEILEYAVRKLNLEPVKIEVKGLKYRRGIQSYNGKEYKYSEYAIRFYPFDNLTEGFFVCKLRK